MSSALWSFLRSVLGRRGSPANRPRLVRRTHTHCPHGGGPVVIELLMSPTGAPQAVLRCSARSEVPPTCDAACRHLAESVVGPACALIICPPGKGLPEDSD
jgi:hypothetical protein